MMDELKIKSNIIDSLMKQCEQSSLTSFSYQDAMFMISFTKGITETDFKANVIHKVAKENTSEIKIGNNGIDLDEYSLSDTSMMDKLEDEDIVTIVSPFVGTLEFSNQIKLVDCEIHVNKGDVICSIEAMKLFNDITAPATGTVVDILVKDCSFVEFEQPILKVRVDKNE